MKIAHTALAEVDRSGRLNASITARTQNTRKITTAAAIRMRITIRRAYRPTLDAWKPFASDELELPAIRERVAAAAATDVGAALARALSPSPDPGEVAARQALTTEAIGLLEESLEPPLEGIRDVREVAALAARGGVLTAGALRHVADTARGSLRARAALETPLLSELAAAIDPELKPLAEAIDRAVLEDGSDLKDNASPRLRKLRGELRTGQAARRRPARAARAQGRHPRAPAGGLRHPARRPARARGQGELAQQRPRPRPRLLRLRPDALRRALRDRRALEPAVRGRGRRARGGRADPARAVRSRRRGGEALALAVEAAGRIDLAIALGIVSRGWRGAPVELSDDVRLLGARHPLLDAATAVPIDLDLGGLRALVISGPNTGGKTVALKTLGLAALLHQSGLRPPAESAALPVFDQVLADIGDRQSIEMSLSTFSGHVANLVAILNAARERSLVLLDEVAAGTDPVEGSALAQALLARLADQARLTVVTTHYSELKEWASTTDGVVNAATGIDPETHAPLYRIVLGRPGISHALEIAERLGLDAGVVGDARERVAPERLRIQELLAEAEAAERDAATEREAAARERSDAEELRASLRAREEELEAAVESVRASAAAERERAADEARRDLSAARTELDALRREIRAARRRRRDEPERDRRLGAGIRARGAGGARDQHLRRAAAPHRPARRRRSGRGAVPRRARDDRRDRRGRGRGGRAGRPPAPRAARTAAARHGSASPRPRRRSASSSPRARTSATSSTCAARGRRRRARRSGRSSTTPPSPGCPRSASSTAAAPAPCAPPSATSSTVIRSSRPARATRPTARPSST